MKQNLHRTIVMLALTLAVTACSKTQEPAPANDASHSLKAKDRWTGEAIFIERCRDCHKVHETGGVVGPDLSSVGTTRSREFLEQVIREPSKLYPGSVMPPYDVLPADQIKLLVDYLSRLK